MEQCGHGVMMCGNCLLSGLAQGLAEVRALEGSLNTAAYHWVSYASGKELPGLNVIMAKDLLASMRRTITQMRRDMHSCGLLANREREADRIIKRKEPYVE